jgi:hypothetical protein
MYKTGRTYASCAISALSGCIRLEQLQIECALPGCGPHPGTRAPGQPALAAESYAGITPWMRARLKTRSASRRWHQASR